jgi:hypothetical protein
LSFEFFQKAKQKTTKNVQASLIEAGRSFFADVAGYFSNSINLFFYERPQ